MITAIYPMYVADGTQNVQVEITAAWTDASGDKRVRVREINGNPVFPSMGNYGLNWYSERETWAELLKDICVISDDGSKVTATEFMTIQRAIDERYAKERGLELTDLAEYSDGFPN